MMVKARFALGAEVALAIVLALTGFSQAAANPTDEIRARLEQPSPVVVASMALDRPMLLAAYGKRNFQPVWPSESGMAHGLTGVLAALDKDGLDAAILEIDRLRAALADRLLAPIDRELLLSDRYLAAAAVLAQGQVAPASLENDWALPRPDFDAASALDRLASTRNPEASLRELAPHATNYQRLRGALERYRGLAASGSWPRLPPDTKIEPGQAGELVARLKWRLIAEGDLPAAARAGDLFDAALGAAVRRFQARHGLAIDGRVGRGTVAALNISAGERVEQIRANLERWRGMPHLWPATRIEVDVPAAMLALYRDEYPVLTSRVIVGAPNHPTPVFGAQAVSVLFNPPWNVPSSIMRKEIEPKLRRDPGYLARNHFVVLGGDGQSGLRLRQLPGAWNSLGLLKLELPNPFDVYLHDTPARSLFAKPARFLSHGCIRVEAVRPLVSALLGPNWPETAIDQPIDEGTTRRVDLPQPVPVYLLYLTTFVDEDGTIEFRDDVYGRDQRLLTALRALPSVKPSAPQAPSIAEKVCPDV